jgi:hypothetical protein
LTLRCTAYATRRIGCGGGWLNTISGIAKRFKYLMLFGGDNLTGVAAWKNW